MRNQISTKKQFKEATKYIKESARYIYASIAIFVIFGVFGFIFRDNLTFLNKLLEELIAKTFGLNGFEMVFFILQNNLQSSLFAILLGSFLGIFPILSSITNGTLIGYVLGITYDISGSVLWWRLLPHGIFELPAIFISFGLGIKLGFSLFVRNRSREFKHRFYNSMNVLLMIVIPLLIIAAIIEGILIAFLR